METNTGSTRGKKVAFLAAAVFQILCVCAIAARYWYVDATGTTYFVRAVGVDPRDLFRGDYVRMAYGPVSSWTGTFSESLRPGNRAYVVPVVRNTSRWNEIVGISSVGSSEPSERPFVRATVASVSYGNPDYSVSLAGSGTTGATLEFSNPYEFPYLPYGEGSYAAGPKTRFAVGSGVLVELSASGTVETLFSDVADCKANTFYSSKVRELTDTEKAEFCVSLPRGTVVAASVKRTLALEYGADRFFVKEDTWRGIEDSIREGEVYAVWKVSDGGTTVLSGLEINGLTIR